MPPARTRGNDNPKVRIHRPEPMGVRAPMGVRDPPINKSAGRPQPPPAHPGAASEEWGAVADERKRQQRQPAKMRGKGSEYGRGGGRLAFLAAGDAWRSHVKATMEKNKGKGLSFKQNLKEAKKTYKKSAPPVAPVAHVAPVAAVAHAPTGGRRLQKKPNKSKRRPAKTGRRKKTRRRKTSINRWF